MRRHLMIAGVIWVVLTIIAEAAIPLLDSTLPAVGAREGEVVESAFRLLLVLGAPVYTFVVSVVVYSFLAFRKRGEPTEDGPPIRSPGIVGPIWLAITGALAIYVIINPGLIGLKELHASSHTHDAMVIKVEGRQWLWRITYPEEGITTLNELVVPVNRTVRFEVTATDVIHSFWVPSWRAKIDAVPGLVTTIHVTPSIVGDYATDPALRLQCAEMCGLAHAQMTASISVKEQAGYDAWVAEQKAKQR